MQRTWYEDDQARRNRERFAAIAGPAGSTRSAADSAFLELAAQAETPNPSGGTIPQDPRPAPPQRTVWDGLALGTGDVVEGLGDLVGLVGNPLYAGVNWATGGASGLPEDLGLSWRRGLGLPEPQNQQERLTGAAIQGGAGGMGSTAVARGATNLVAGPVARTVWGALASPTEEIVGGAAAGLAQQGVQEMGGGPILSTLAAFAGGGAGAMGANALRRWWASQGRNVDGVADAELISGSLDGSIDPSIRLQPDDIDVILRGSGNDPASFSDPELMAARVMEARGRPRSNDLTPDELARQATIARGIDDGAIDPAWMPQPPPRVMPDDVPIIAAPEGNVRGDDLGAMTGLARQQMADEGVLARARILAERDPTIAAILKAPGANQRQQIRTVWDRINQGWGAMDRGERPADLADLPEPDMTPYQAPTPEDARAIAEGPSNIGEFMARVRRGESSGDDQARNPRSTATGRYQFTDGTWLNYYRRRFGNRDSDAQALARRGDGRLQDQLMEDLTRDNAAALRGAGIEESPGNLYLAHFAGSAGARALHSAAPGASAADVLGAGVVRSNPHLRGMSARDVIAWAHRQMGGSAPETPFRMAAPDGDDIGGMYTATERPNPDGMGEPRRQDFRGWENSEAMTSPTQGEMEQGFTNRVTGTGDNMGLRQDPVGAQTPSGRERAGMSRSGNSERPFRDVGDDPAGQPGFWEDRARAQAEEAFRTRQADLEAEWERRRQAREERQRRGGKTRFEEERTASEDPSQRYGSNAYGQRPGRAGDFWRTTDDGIIADRDGKPVAFRNHKAAAKWAAENELGGDFELGAWAANSSRIILRRRANSTYGQGPAAPERPTPGAGPVDPPAGRSGDESQRAISGPPDRANSDRPLPEAEASKPAERPAGGQNEAVSAYTPPPEPRPAPRPAPAAEKRAPLIGDSEKVATARGREIHTQFEVREADDLVTSDMAAYDPDLQPRDRAQRSSSDAQIAQIAAKLDPEQLGSSRLASQGAPIVGTDRMVDSGNGRVMAIRRAYEMNPRASRAYRQFVESKGFKLDGFDKPVLVRRHGLQGEERQSFVREANERDTMQLSSTEQARGDAAALSDKVLELYRGGSVSGLANRDFARAWMDEVATPADRNNLMQPDGSLSAEGIRRMRSSLLSRAFGDDNLVAKIVEDPDNEIRAIGNTLTDAAPGFAKLKRRVESGDLPREFDITRQVAEMAHTIARARSEGRKVADLVRQDDMFAGRTDPVTEAVTRLMFRDEALTKPRSASDMADGLRFYLDEAERRQSGPGLLDDAPATSPAEVLDAARKRLEERSGNGNGESTLFLQGAAEKTDARGGLQPLAAAMERIAREGPSIHYRSMAERLAGLVQDAQVRYGGLPPGYRGSATLSADGTASARIGKRGDVEAELHEAIHVATLARYGELVDGAKTGTGADPIIRELESLRSRALKAFRDRDGEETRYALSSNDEFLAHGLTSPEFQSWLRTKQTAGLWGRFTDWIRDLLGFSKREGNLLDGVLQAGARLFGEMEETAPGRGGDEARLDMLGRADREAMERTIERHIDDGKLDRADALIRRLDDEDGDIDREADGSWGDRNVTLYSRRRQDYKKIADPTVDLGAIRGDMAAFRKAFGEPRETLERLTRPMRDFVSWAMFTADARVRTLAEHFDSPAMREFADLWHPRAGKGDATGRTYHEAVTRNSSPRIQRAYEALEPHRKSRAAMDRIRELLTHPNKTMRAAAAERQAAAEVRDLLKETIDYRKAAGEDIGEVSDGYVPRVLSLEKVAKAPDKFLATAETLYKGLGVDDPKGAAEAWLHRVIDEYAGLDGGLESLPRAGGAGGSRSAKSREFGKQADTLLREFYEDDLFHTLSSYFVGAARRAEHARRFGPKGAEGSAEREAWTAEHGNKSQLDVLLERVKDDIRASGKDERGALAILKDVHAANLGLKASHNPKVRSAISGLHTWNQLAKLDRVTLTSLGELTMGFIRGGPRYGFPFLKDSLQEAARQIRHAAPSDGERWANAVGVYQDAMVNQALLTSINAEDSVRSHQRLLAGFYKGTGLHQYTNATRIAAVKMGRHFIRNLADDLQSPTARVRQRAGLYLRELGISDPATFAAKLRDGEPSLDTVIRDRGIGAEYGTALLRFVNQSIMMPSRAEKPVWASHPLGSLIFSLSSYSYAFKKNVLDRGGRLAKEGVRTRDPKLLIPAMSLSIMAAFQALNDTYLRPLLFGSAYDFSEESPTEFMIRVADRSGFTGGLSPFVNAIKAVRYDRDLSTSLSGPVVGSLLDTGQKTLVEPYAGRNSPNTNTAERNQVAAIFDAVIEPAIDASAARYAGGMLRTGIILGSGNREGGIAPSDRETFVETFGGEREE